MLGRDDRPVFAEVKCKVGEKGFWMYKKSFVIVSRAYGIKNDQKMSTFDKMLGEEKKSDS